MQLEEEGNSTDNVGQEDQVMHKCEKALFLHQEITKWLFQQFSGLEQ